jgi:hypothetical protein
MKQKWYVGQKVWDEALRPGLVGVIEQTNIDADYAIKVRFNGGSYTYDMDGRFYSMYSPTLRPYPHKITIERIEPEFEKGQIVLVRDLANEYWKSARYIGMEEEQYVCTQWHEGDSGEGWEFCIPFEGNEHLLLTTQEP